MEKKTRFYLILAALLLAGLGGAILGIKMAGFGRSGAAPGSSLDDREIKALERGLEEGSQRSAEEVEGALRGAGSIEEGIGRIGEDAVGIGDGLEDIGGILEELQKRSRRGNP